MSAQRAADRFRRKMKDVITVHYTLWATGWRTDSVSKSRSGTRTEQTAVIVGNSFEPDIASFKVQQFTAFEAGDLIIDVATQDAAFLDNEAITGVRFEVYGVSYTSKRFPDQVPESYETGPGSKVLRRLFLSRARVQ